MITRQSAVLFVRVPAVPAEIDAEWNAWYDTEHARAIERMPGVAATVRR